MSGLIIYPNAIEACFDFAGREMVEHWQDEMNEAEAEEVARQYLLEAQSSDLIRAITFGHPHSARQVAIREF